MTDTATARKAGPVLATLLLLLTVFVPISMDLYGDPSTFPVYSGK
ncbi:MAG: hypothetical protein ACK5MT_05430 [Actinomycetales bacterium]